MQGVAFWAEYFRDINSAIQHNFFGNRMALSDALRQGDPYAKQLLEMGYIIDHDPLGERTPFCPPFQNAVHWVNMQLDAIPHRHADLTEGNILRPAKAFDCDGGVVRFIEIGGPVPLGCRHLNLLPPSTFVDMLAAGYFPMGDATVEHTNQCLAEHDLAHMCAFIAEPYFMAAIRGGFTYLHGVANGAEGEVMSQRVRRALDNVDSMLSLRLYYLVEVSTYVPMQQRARLTHLLGEASALDGVNPMSRYLDGLLVHDPSGAVLYAYLDAVYSAFPSLVESIGGESRDIHNRERKFARGTSMYTSKMVSKFNDCSVWSLYLNARFALNQRRVNHDGFRTDVLPVHARFLACLRSIAQVSFKELVDASVRPVPDTSTDSAQYIIRTFDENNVLRRVYTLPNFDLAPFQDA